MTVPSAKELVELAARHQLELLVLQGHSPGGSQGEETPPAVIPSSKGEKRQLRSRELFSTTHLPSFNKDETKSYMSFFVKIKGPVWFITC